MTIFGLLMVAVGLGAVFYQLRRGNLLDRTWRAYTTREGSPKLYLDPYCGRNCGVSFFALHAGSRRIEANAVVCR